MRWPDSVSRKTYVTLPGLPVIRIDSQKCYGHSPSTPRGCRGTSITFTKATEKCSGFRASVPECAGRFPPYFYMRSIVYTASTSCKSKIFHPFPTRLALGLPVSSSVQPVLHIRPESRYKCLINCTSVTHLYLTAFSTLGKEDIISHSSAAGSWTACLMLNLCICENRRWQI